MQRVSWLLGAIFALCFAGNLAAKPLMYLPFEKNSSWYCVQGPGGSYSHTGDLKYSYDFNQGSGPNGAANPAFGKWVYSPVKGVVTKVVNNITDFTNNSGSNSSNNYGYGNEVIIKAYKASSSATQYYVRLLHFKKGSIQVKVDDQVEISSPLGQIGQTGFSTGPHLHVHLSTSSSASTSAAFDFVEGPVKSGKWYKSDSTAFSSVMDNDKSTSVGSAYTYAYTGYTGTWQSSTSVPTYTGSSYMFSSSTNQPFKWQFKVAQSGYYLVMARNTAYPNRDTKALYKVNGKSYYVNQTQYTETGWRTLGFMNLNANYLYDMTVQATTPSKYVSADAIDLIRAW